jgi:SAM-dependent methyltransferase
MLFLRLRDRLRLVRTDSGDFSDRELYAIKEEIGQVYLDVSTKLAPNDFAKDLKKLRLSAECVECARRPECAGAWQPVAGDLFTRDDARVREIVGGLRGRVLDIGSGEGGYMETLVGKAREGSIEYVCVDPDEMSLSVLASRYPFARFIVGFAEELGDDVGVFDHVLVLRSYNHLTDPAKVLRRLIGLLADGGTLTLVDNVAFGLVRQAALAARAEAAPENRFEHYRNDGAAEAAATVDELSTSPREDGRALRLLERRDVGHQTSNQWLLRYECVGQGRVRA